MRRSAGRMLASLLVAAFGAVGLAAPALAEPKISVALSVTEAYIQGGSLYVTGNGRTVQGDPLDSAGIMVYVGEGLRGSTLTNADGSFTYATAAPGPGRVQIKAYYPGSEQYKSATATYPLTVPPAAGTAQAATAISISLSPTAATPGAVVAISGKLVSGSVPVGSAVVSLTTDYGTVDQATGTGADGSFKATVVVTDGDNLPPSFTVTVSFAGDRYYAAATAKATGTITTPEATPSPTPSETPSPTPTPEPTPDVAGSVSSDASTPEGFDAPMSLVGAAFFTVALVAAGTLVILGIIAHDRRRLARGERRGFGTDFGKRG